MPTITRRHTVTYNAKEVAEIMIGDSEPGCGDYVIDSRGDEVVMTLAVNRRVFSDAAKEDSQFTSDQFSVRDIHGEVTVEPSDGSVTVVLDDER